MQNISLSDTLNKFKTAANVAVITNSNSAGSGWTQNRTIAKSRPLWAESPMPVIVNKTKFICPYCYAIGELGYVNNHSCFQEGNNSCPACSSNANSAHVNSAGCYQSYRAMRNMSLTATGVKYDTSSSSWLVPKETRLAAYIKMRETHYDIILYINNILTSEEKSYNANGYHGICHWFSQIAKILLTSSDFTLPCNCFFDAQQKYYGITTVDVIAFITIKYGITLSGKDNACPFCPNKNMVIGGKIAAHLYFCLMVQITHMQDSTNSRDNYRNALIIEVEKLSVPQTYVATNIAKAFNEY